MSPALMRPRPIVVAALAALAALAACTTAVVPIERGPSAAVELTAIRALLGSDRPGPVLVDSLFASPGQAPPAMTTQVRPRWRQQLLVDSLAGLAGTGADATRRIRASDPVFRGDTATVSVTLDRLPAPGGRARRSYETVEVVLTRQGARWTVRRRMTLGVS